jgi:hypothetical protein
MQRRSFIYGAALFAVANRILESQQTCLEVTDTPDGEIMPSAYPDYVSYLTARYPLPKVTPIIQFKVSVKFIDNALHSWKRHPEGRARIERAAALFQSVWSSQEFKDAVCSIPQLTWRDDPSKPPTPEAMISGKDLYPKLVGVLDVTIPLQMVDNIVRSYWGNENAATTPGANTTTIEYRYANTNARVYQLVNTLSHEYTHYTTSAASWDQGHSGLRKAYVSYGIGGLTENLAANTKLSCDDPR